MSPAALFGSYLTNLRMISRVWTPLFVERGYAVPLTSYST